MDFPGTASTLQYLLKTYQRECLNISCGKYTYGTPRVVIANSDSPRKLTIGNYCSIASETLIFVGRQGRHPMDTITSYPISMVIEPEDLAMGDVAAGMSLGTPDIFGSRVLDVDIGNDVWIGTRSTILAGITIGTGVVIGAGSIVTKDIPPYAVVAGVPARVIRYRFDSITIERLLATKWWMLTPDKIWGICGSAFQRPPISFALEMLESAQHYIDDKIIPEFDEKNYLLVNIDVKEAVEAGRFKSGLEHFNNYGRYEGRNIR